MAIHPDRIKGIIFDVDGTLFYHLPIRIIVISALVINNIFAPVYLLRIIKILRSYRKMQEILRDNSGSHCALPDTQLQMTVEASRELPGFVQQTVAEWMMKRPLPFLKYFLRSGLVNFLKMMEGRALKLGVYSDYPCTDKLEHMNIANFFSSVVSSCDPDVQKLKPDPKGFLVCSKELGLKPEEVLFVGDRESVDAVGAERSGMQVVLVGGIFKKKSLSGKQSRYRSFNTLCEEVFGV